MYGRGLLGIVAFAAALGLATAVPAAAMAQSYDVSADHVNCDTVGGTIKFGTALHAGGPATSAGANFKGTLAGCTDTSNAAVKMFHGSYSGSFAGSSTDCASWFGGALDNALSGAWTLQWSPSAYQDFTPKTTVGATQKRLTQSPITDWIAQSPGTVGTLPGSYQHVSIVGGAATGQFTGASTPIFSTYLATDYGNIFSQCAATRGLTMLSVGIGNFQAGGAS